jgi:DNA polymerase III subunit epsilon
LEAGVRELRMLSAHAPPYNRRSRFPHRWWWIVLSNEAFPRFSTVRTPRHDRAVGPFRSRADAADTAALLARFTGVRTCTKRLARSALHGPACPQHEVSPCPAARDVMADQYAAATGRAAALIDGADNTALAAAVQQIADLAVRQRYESAARLRNHTVTAVEVLWRGQRLRALATLPELVAAAPDGDGGWQLAVIRYGQLAAAGTARRGVPPMPVVDAIRAGAQVVLHQPAPLGGALVEETALIVRWLAAPGVRIVAVTGGDDAGWFSPLRSAGPFAQWAASARSARVAAEQAVTSRDSELLAEPHPSREQLFGSAAVNRVGGAAQPVLPRRQPLGAAG